MESAAAFQETAINIVHSVKVTILLLAIVTAALLRFGSWDNAPCQINALKMNIGAALTVFVVTDFTELTADVFLCQ